MQSKSNQVRPISQSSGVAREEAKGGWVPLKLYCIYIFAVHIFIGQLFNSCHNTNIIDIILVFAFGDFFHCLLLLYEQQTVFETAQIYKIFPGSAPRSIPAYATAFAVRFKVNSSPVVQDSHTQLYFVHYCSTLSFVLYSSCPPFLVVLYTFPVQVSCLHHMLIKKNISSHI